MNARKETRGAWRDLCRDLREDDGIDPRKLKKQSEVRGPTKFGPLCKQVERCLQLALAGCGDELIRDLTIVQVDPAPDATRLRVQVRRTTGIGGREAGEIEDRLGRLKGYLRAEIAAAVQRKRAPDLTFGVVASMEDQP